jgi:hypothetical protein
MDGAPKRSASVTAAAVVAILSSLFLLLCCSVAFFGMLSLKLTGTSPELPPFVRTAALAAQGFMMCLSLFGVATGIGLIYLRNWARISILTWGGLCVFFGAIGIPIGFFALSSPLPNAPPLPAEGMAAVRWILVSIYGLPLLAGIWWLILFNRMSVKAQFEGVAISSDPSVPQKPRCPLPIAVLAWFYITTILNLLFLPFFHFRVPILVFGWLLPPGIGLAVLILNCLALFLAGVGLLKLKPWSYSLTIGLQLFWLASTIVTALSPNYYAVMESFLKDMQASLHLPETQFLPNNITQHYGWAIGVGLLIGGGILGLLVYYRPRFLEEASKASSAT